MMTSSLRRCYVTTVLCLCFIVTESVLQDDFLLLTDSAAGAIYQVSRSGEHVTRLDLNTSNQVPVAVDYDPDERRIYWTDVGGHAIWSSHLDNSQRKLVLQLTSQSSPEGVAVDPVAGLLFYTDQGQDVISILKTDGTEKRTLIRNVGNPRSICLDPIQRRVYWADWGRNTIERADYDGSDRQILYKTNQSWINGLDLDLKNGHLYWVDAYADVILRMDMDGGKNMTVIVNGNKTTPRGYNGTGNPHFYGISLDDEFIYVSDWDRKGLFSVRKNGSDFRLLHSPFLVPSGLVSYRSSWYVRGHTSGCNDISNQNGGCSNLCVPTPEGVTCMCPDGMKLADDGKICDSVVVSAGPDVIWLEHDKLSTSYIMGMSGEPSVYLSARRFGERWSIRSPLWHWTSVDNDYRKNSLYLADKEDNLVVQLSLTKNLTIDVIHFGTSSSVNGIAVDWIGHNVYWTDSLFKWIIMVKAVKNSPVMRTVVFDRLDRPHGIVVWPQKGLLLWTDWGSVQKIESSTLSGSERRILVSSDLNFPTGLTVDYGAEKLYWCNRDSIEQMNADGTARRRLYTYPSAHFMDVAHYDKYLFATDRNQFTGSYKLWILNTADTTALYPRLLLQRPPFGVTMLTESRQEHMTTACDKSNCSQLCVVRANQTAECLCGDGYDLEEDGKSCTENKQTFTGPAIIYSLGDRLCSVRIQEAMGFIKDPDVNCFFVDARYSFRALDYDYSSGNIYFSEVKYRVRSIRVAHMKNITDNKAIVQGTGYVNGIAVDYAAGNLYWTDSTHGQIWVSRLDGGLQKILIRDLQYPMGIAIDQLEKKLYWSERGSDTESGSLKQANLDGSNIVKLNIMNIHQPAGVSFNPLSRILSWVDQGKGTVEHIRPDDMRGHRVIVLPGLANSAKKKLYDIATFQDFHLYTEWNVDNVSGVHVVDTDSGREVNSNLLHASHSTAYDVIVFSKQYQAEYYPGNGTLSCLVDYGGCEQLCLQIKNGRQCVCVDGMVTVDETKCRANLLRKEAFFLVADDYRHQIYQMGAELKNDDLTAVTLPLADRPIALAYDFTYERVYWTDFNEGVIKRSFLNGSQPETVFVGAYGSRIDGLAFDHESRILYYTDTNHGYIGVLNPSGTYHKIIVKESLTNPRAIVLDTKMGYMYYTVRETSKGRIERRDLTGRNPFVLVDTSLSWPNGLDIDFEEGRLYWVDAHTETIESCNLDGTNRQVIYSDNRESDPFGLAIQGSFVYWTDWTYQGVYRIPKHGGNITVYYEDELRGLNDLKFFNKSALRGANVCSYDRGGCSHFCLSGPDNTRICECPDGYRIGEDEVTCLEVPTCSQKIPNGQIDPACSRDIGEMCSYVCGHGYERTRRSGITCNSDLEWDVDINTLCAYDVCPLLPNPIHATVDVQCPLVAVPGTSCVHQCDSGYIQVGGDMRRYCTEEKKWTGRDIICLPIIRCAPLDVDDAIIVSPQSCVFSHAIPGQICELRCKPGYQNNNGDTVTGVSVQVCLSDSSWNGTELNCVKAVEMYTKPAVTTPILIGVVIACVSLVLLIILISILLIRRRNKRMARYRASSNIPPEHVIDSSTSTYDLHIGKEVNGNSPVYDARTDRVDLGGKLLSFDNPVYGVGTRTDGATSPSASLVARQGSLSSESDMAGERTEFDNPLYDKEKAEKDKVDEVERALSGSRVRPDLTRELSTA